jgi:hypothetical protein
MVGNVNVPIAVIIYNRPDHTAWMLGSLQEIRPKNLYVISDGPKDASDAEKVRETRELLTSLPWNCTVHKNYADRNLGCQERVNSGLDWLFDRVDRAIVIEDDIVPQPCFYRNTAHLLERFAADDSLKMVAGRNHLVSFPPTDLDYFVSHRASIWGWGTWADRWQAFRKEFPAWSFDDLQTRMHQHYGDSENTRLPLYLFKHQIAQKLDDWGTPWSQWILARKGLCLVPVQNLVQNIGFSTEATHTRNENDIRGNYPVFADLASDRVDVCYDRKGIEYDRSFPILEMLLNYDYNHVKKLLLLARNYQKMNLPGNAEGWELMLTPFQKPAEASKLLSHIKQWIDHPQLNELSDIFERLNHD